MKFHQSLHILGNIGNYILFYGLHMQNQIDGNASRPYTACSEIEFLKELCNVIDFHGHYLYLATSESKSLSLSTPFEYMQMMMMEYFETDVAWVMLFPFRWITPIF